MATRQGDGLSFVCCCHGSTDAARRFEDVGVWMIVGFDGADGVSYLFLFSEEEKKDIPGTVHTSFFSSSLYRSKLTLLSNAFFSSSTSSMVQSFPLSVCPTSADSPASWMKVFRVSLKLFDRRKRATRVLAKEADWVVVAIVVVGLGSLISI